MIEVKDQTIENQTVVLDDHYFVNCHIKNCTVVYMGGDFGWIDSTIEGDLLKFEGPAHRTVIYLGNLQVLTLEFAKSMGIDTKPQESVLEDEIAKARDSLMAIRLLASHQAFDIHPNEIAGKILGIIERYFNKQASGSSEGIGNAG